MKTWTRIGRPRSQSAPMRGPAFGVCYSCEGLHLSFVQSRWLCPSWLRVQVRRQEVGVLQHLHHKRVEPHVVQHPSQGPAREECPAYLMHGCGEYNEGDPCAKTCISGCIYGEQIHNYNQQKNWLKNLFIYTFFHRDSYFGITVNFLIPEAFLKRRF